MTHLYTFPMNSLLWFEYFLVYIGQWKCRKILLIIDTYMHIVHFKINFLTNFVFGLGLNILFWDIPHLSTLIRTVSKEWHIHNKQLLTVPTVLQGSFMKCVMSFIKLLWSYKASRECERTKKGKYLKKYEIRFMWHNLKIISFMISCW